MTYITGDIHGDVYDLLKRCRKIGAKAGDTVIILGDASFNYFLSERDNRAKEVVNGTGIIFFCIHGNHEARPQKIDSYKIKECYKGKVYYQEQFPNILFAIDGEVYDIDNKKVLVLGGAYSVDKYFRAYKYYCIFENELSLSEYTKLLKLAESSRSATKDDKRKVDKIIDSKKYGSFGWFNDEQPDDDVKEKVKKCLDNINWKVDVVLSHTCPIKFEPTEVFLPGLNQSIVDKSTEEWLQKIYDKLKFKHWYAGHYHTNKKVGDNFTFLYRDIEPF